MARLSVNINKLATLRNARGGNNPDVLAWAMDIERFGAQGITVHPRPDERHVRFADVYALAPKLTTEFNIEGSWEDCIAWVNVMPPGHLGADPQGVLTAGRVGARARKAELKPIVER